MKKQAILKELKRYEKEHPILLRRELSRNFWGTPTYEFKRVETLDEALNLISGSWVWADDINIDIYFKNITLYTYRALSNLTQQTELSESRKEEK